MSRTANDPTYETPSSVTPSSEMLSETSGAGASDDETSSVKARRAWTPHDDLDTMAALRRLMARPWLIAGRDDDTIAIVRRNLPTVRAVLEGRLGWSLVCERDFVRLRKKPPARIHAYAQTGPAAQSHPWFFLIVAAAESMVNPFPLRTLIAATQAAAGEAGIETTGDIAERRAVVAALRSLIERGILDIRDGDVSDYLANDDPCVLLTVHHTRLLQVIANYSESVDPVTDPAGWIAAVSREPDVARRMRQRLCDDSVVHVCDLDEAESDWMRRRVRGDDGVPVASAFGMHVERRQEGAAFVVSSDEHHSNWELGPIAFPAAGTSAHAALLICGWALRHATAMDNRPGWRTAREAEVGDHLAELVSQVASGRGGWRSDLAEDPHGRLCAEVRDLLEGLDLIRVHSNPPVWDFSPAIARWDAPAGVEAPTRKARTYEGQGTLSLDGSSAAAPSDGQRVTEGTGPQGPSGTMTRMRAAR